MCEGKYNLTQMELVFVVFNFNKEFSHREYRSRRPQHLANWLASVERQKSFNFIVLFYFIRHSNSKGFAYLFFFSKSRVQFPAREGKNVFKNGKNDLEAVVEKVSKLLVIKRYPFTSIIPVLMSIFLICQDSFLHTPDKICKK